MKNISNKFIICALAICTVSFSFIYLKSKSNVDYSKLSRVEQGYMRNALVTKLKKDSSFLVYSEISKMQTEALLAVDFSIKRTHSKDTRVSQRTIKGLTSYYREAGLEKPDQFAKLDILKRALLISLTKKYPELKKMSVNEKISVFKSAKKPLLPEEKARQKAIFQKTLMKSSIR